MQDAKIRAFMTLAGQKIAIAPQLGTPEQRRLGAQLLLSECLEYVIKGLGVLPEFNGTQISDANALRYVSKAEPEALEMLDGLSDVAYTMYWNALAFGLPLEKAFDLVCDNNLEKFVRLPDWQGPARPLERSEWACSCEISWPSEVVQVEVLQVGSEYFAVGKDAHGKVRKPSSYTSVDLRALLK
jgi:hypothetical protein